MFWQAGELTPSLRLPAKNRLPASIAQPLKFKPGRTTPLMSFPRRACPREGVGRETRRYAIGWIPACAGMTNLRPNVPVRLPNRIHPAGCPSN
jgi:hypothetical protein